MNFYNGNNNFGPRDPNNGNGRPPHQPSQREQSLTPFHHPHRPQYSHRVIPEQNCPPMITSMGTPMMEGHVQAHALAQAQPANRDNTQLLLDRVYQQERMQAHARRGNMRTSPQKSVVRQPPPQQRPSCGSRSRTMNRPKPTFEEMVLAGFDRLSPAGDLPGLHFQQIVAFIRSRFQLSLRIKQTLEFQVNKTLERMINNGIVTQTYGVLPMDGAYRLVGSDRGFGLNLTVRGESLPVYHVKIPTGVGLPGPNSHLCRTVPVTPVKKHVKPAPPRNIQRVRDFSERPNRDEMLSRFYQNTGLPRKSRPYTENNDLITKSFGERAGNALNKNDVGQRPNTPFSGYSSKPSKRDETEYVDSDNSLGVEYLAPPRSPTSRRRSRPCTFYNTDPRIMPQSLRAALDRQNEVNLPRLRNTSEMEMSKRMRGCNLNENPGIKLEGEWPRPKGYGNVWLKKKPVEPTNTTDADAVGTEVEGEAARDTVTAGAIAPQNSETNGIQLNSNGNGDAPTVKPAPKVLMRKVIKVLTEDSIGCPNPPCDREVKIEEFLNNGNFDDLCNTSDVVEYAQKEDRVKEWVAGLETDVSLSSYSSELESPKMTGAGDSEDTEDTT